WDVDTGKEQWTVPVDLSLSKTPLALLPDAKTVLLGGGESCFVHLDARTGKEMRVWGGHRGAVTQLAVEPKTGRVWTASQDKTVTGHSHSVTTVALSPDGKWAVSGSEDSTVRVWYLPNDGKDVEPLVLKGHTHEVTAVVFLPDGKHVLSASKDQTLKLWSLDD